MSYRKSKGLEYEQTLSCMNSTELGPSPAHTHLSVEGPKLIESMASYYTHSLCYEQLQTNKFQGLNLISSHKTKI